ncbi:Uncharacterised protein [Mycobacteroides abscessus subsp. massiliense]|nr:Uncharacterised protein [Mycobacteroides abscessus subsp. massiliense]
MSSGTWDFISIATSSARPRTGVSAERRISWAKPSFPSGTATSGTDEPGMVTTASTRSPMVTRMVSALKGCTGKPSVWVTVIGTPGMLTRNAVSPPALTMRNRTRCPAR